MGLSLKDKIALKILGETPINPGYTVIDGCIHGPVRYESFDGGEKYIDSGSPDGLTFFDHTPPSMDKDGRVWSISPIQKKSKGGWLLTDPHCYFWWKMEKLQDVDASGAWIPGTEYGWYQRSALKIPFPLPCWRIDFAGTDMGDGILRNWIPSWGHLSRHYD